MSMETLRLNPPAGFDPNNSQHVARIVERVVEKLAGKSGAGSDVTEQMGENRADWKVLSFDSAKNELVIYRRAAVTQLSAEERGTITVGIPEGTKGNELEGVAERLQALHPGYYLTDVNPHLGRAKLAKLTDAELRVREALATSIGVKAWDIADIKGSRKTGYSFRLPSNYMASKHDDKLQEVAETIAGEFGWYFEADPVSLKARLVPSLPPTFPASIPYPMELLPKPTPGLVNPIPFGMALADRGDEANEVIYLKMEDAPHSQVGGTSGSGKRQSLRTRIPTPTGWTTMGALRVGDEVLSRNGEPCRVTSLSDIENTPNLYAVTLSDGQVVEADFDHQWVVSTMSQRNRKRTKKYQRSIEKWERMTAFADGVADLAIACDETDERTDAQLLGLLDDVPGNPWTVPASVRSALLFMDVPSRKAELVTTASDGRVMRVHPVVYPTKLALAKLSERVRWVAGEERTLDADERILTTGEMLAEGLLDANAGARFAIRTARGLLLPDVDLPVAPYTFGAWLGDGTSRNDGITTADEEIVQRIRRDGFVVRRVEENPDSKAATHHFDGLHAAISSFLRGEGGKLDKRIPAVYLRASYYQRLALLQGLMDTDGYVSEQGVCELTLTKRDLAGDALELIRSLGIKATVREADAAFTHDGTRNVIGTRYRICFTTTEPVFEMRRKYDRLPKEVRETQQWLYVKSIEPIAPVPARCIQVDSPDSTYLAEGFVPTHNSVTLNSIVAGALAAGAELAIVDVPAKAVDYELWRPYVRKGGWGCESFEENAIMLQEIYNEGTRRAETLKRYGAKKLTELPPDVLATMPPVLIVCDEVTGLFAPANEKPPRGLPSDHPLVVEAMSKATASAMIQSYIAKIAAELRFVGFKLILATQVASTATGITTALRTNLGNKLLLGARATDGNRKLILADVSAAPEIPKHIQQAEGMIPKGVGVSELEAQRPVVFKSFYASEKDFIRELNKRGVKGLPLDQLDSYTRPDPKAVKESFPDAARLAEERRFEESKKFGKEPQELQDWQMDPNTGERLDGRQAANRAKHLLTVQAKQAEEAAKRARENASKGDDDDPLAPALVPA